MLKCKICGWCATGIHYGVLSCEGCKVFFKRGLVKAHKYSCLFGNKCYGNGQAGNRCKACRFKRCIDLGMSVAASKRGRRVKGDTLRLLTEESSNADTSDYETDAPVDLSEHTETAKQMVTHPIRPSLPSSFDSILQVKNQTSGGTVKELEEDQDDLSLSLLSLLNPNPSSSLHWTRTSSNEGAACRLVNRTSRVSLLPLLDSSDEPCCNALATSCNSALVVAGYSDEEVQENEVTEELPEFLSDYLTAVTRKRNLMHDLENKMADVVNRAFGDIVTLWDAFRDEVRRRGVVPDQQVSRAQIFNTTVTAFTGFIKRACQFLFLLPGFDNFDASDKAILVAEKFTETWTVFHAPYVIDGEWHCLIGSEKDMHMSQKWMRRIFEADHFDLMTKITTLVGDLELTHLELFLFLASSIFHPDYTTAKNKALLSHLQSYYMNCLLHSIRSRCSKMDQIRIELKLQNFTHYHIILHRLGKTYHRLMNYNSLPFKAVTGSKVLTIKDAIELQEEELEQGNWPAVFRDVSVD